MLAVNLHFGKKNARIDKANQDTLPTIPEFATMDLFSSYTDYLLGMFESLSNLHKLVMCAYAIYNFRGLLAMCFGV